jgi:hypothetical protein
VYWDDLELLRVTDDLERTEISSLSNGLYLMQKAAQSKPLDPSRDYVPFVHELLLARHAGYVDFEDRWTSADPAIDPNLWLQQIRDIRLTLAGRDRARGRVVLLPLQDPDEDDGRHIAGITLAEIAHAIGDSYLASQLPTFLLDSSVPPQFIPEESADNKWEYVRAVLIRLHDGGSDARRVLRTFIGQWLGDRLHTGPSSDARQQILRQLFRQGWHLQDDRLVVGRPGDMELATISAATPADTTMQSIRTLEGLFRRFRKGARLLLERHRDRPAVHIRDEYDLQDYLHSVLAMLFDDVRPEEHSSSRAGAAARLDFLLKHEQIAIETKMTRKGVSSKAIGEELIVDIERYRAHPDCKGLAALVYDPEQLIANPRGFERDLNSDSADMRVLVVVCQ